MRKQVTWRPALAGCMLTLTIAGCSGSPQAPGGDDTMQPDASFIAEENAWRARRDESLRKPDGWTSLIGLHWIELKAHFIGSDATSGIRLAKGPPKLGMLQRESERVFFTPEQDVALTLDGEPVVGRVDCQLPANLYVRSPSSELRTTTPTSASVGAAAPGPS